MHVEAVDPSQGAIAHPQAIRSHSGPLGEHPHFRPRGIPSRAPRSHHDFRILDQMKIEDHADVRESVEPCHHVGVKTIAVEPDDSIDGAPFVVDGIGATSEDETNRLKGDHDDPS